MPQCAEVFIPPIIPIYIVQPPQQQIQVHKVCSRGVNVGMLEYIWNLWNLNCGFFFKTSHMLNYVKSENEPHLFTNFRERHTCASAIVQP